MKLLKKNKQVGSLQGFVMAIVGIAVVLAVGLVVLSELASSAIGGGAAINTTSYCSTTSGAWNGTGCTGGTLTHDLPQAFTATNTTAGKLGTVPTWIGILITVALAFIVLGYFYGRRA